MIERNLAAAAAYLKAIETKDLPGISALMHPDIELIGPLAKLRGKDAYVEAIKKVFARAAGVTARERFSAGDQVMMAYDLRFPDPVGPVRTASLMTFTDDLISRIELFFDARPFGDPPK